MSLITTATLFTFIAIASFIGKYYNLNSKNENRPMFEKTLLCATFNTSGIIFGVMAALLAFNMEYGNTIHCIVGQSDSTIIDTIIIDKPVIVNKPIVEKKNEETAEAKGKENVGFTTHVTLTVYNPTEAQCDGDPLTTADGTKIDKAKLKRGEIKYCAVSDDLLWALPFNSVIEIDGHGQYIVHDRMNSRWKHHIDLLQDESEQQFSKKNVKIRRVA